MRERMKVSILIKAFNEEALISECVETALAELKNIEGEIILVDSLSTDKTVEIAKHYPIRIIQFEKKEDCGCASAVQLAYQYAHGDYIYVLDGDMKLHAGFLSLALDYLEVNPDVGGVAGKLVDLSIKTANDKRRVQEIEAIQQITQVTELGGGGLYRRKAIESVAYLSHRWLPACEEAELGARLTARGWRLIRLPDIAVFHTGYSENEIERLCRLWRSRRIQAYGMYLRTAFGHPWFWITVWYVRFCFFALVVHCIAGLIVAGLVHYKVMALGLAMVSVEFLIWGAVLSYLMLGLRKKTLSEAMLAVFTWHLYTLATFLGVLRPVPSPEIPINARELNKK
jgi:glycosyltransferase involved in cell wall biosynthesis